jgi:hypothetical protein
MAAKKYDYVRLDLVIEDPATGRIQNFIIQGVNFTEPQDQVLLVQGEDAGGRRVHLTFTKKL